MQGDTEYRAEAADATAATPGAGGSSAVAGQKIGVLEPNFTICRDTIRQRELERKSALVRAVAHARVQVFSWPHICDLPSEIRPLAEGYLYVWCSSVPVELPAALCWYYCSPGASPVLTFLLLQLVFENMPLLCQLVTHEQAVTDKVPVASSKRSRRGRVDITASHTISLRTLKLRLFNELDVHPMNMDCYVKGRLLDNDDQNLQQLQVAYTDVVNIVKVDRVPNDDYALLIEWQNMTGLDTDVVVAAKSGGAPIKERGFVDTLLAGGP